MHKIRVAHGSADFAALGVLFREYERALGVDLCFQGFEKELADIASAYVVALIAGPAEEPAGCVALKRLTPAVCEMKRLYVRPAARGTHLGRALADSIVAQAREHGFTEMALDSFERLDRAVAMYERMGFRRSPPHADNPEPDAVFMRMAL